MKKNIHFAVKLLTLLLPAVLFFACSDLDSDTGSSGDGEAYVRVRSGSIARTVLPQVNTLSDFTLKGKNGSAETLTLASADTLEDLSEKVITVRKGSWLFTLSAHCNGVLFSGEVSKNIEAGTTTSLSFLLTTDAAYGGFSVTVSFEENAVLATGSLTSENGSPALAETELEITASAEGGVQKNQVTFARAFTADEGIAAGTYRATIRFYADTEKTIPLCTYTEIIRIAGGYQSLAERFLSLDETYSIEYDDDGGSLKGGESKATLFSRKSIVSLPRMKKENAYFRGWYDNAAFSGSPVTEIPAGTTGNQHLYAKYQPAEMYVSGTGDDVNGDGSEDNPFESLDKACEEIITITEAETDSGIMDWTIYIMGDVTGPHEGTNKAGSRTYSKDYGRSVIPAEITSSHAKSILLTGYTELVQTDVQPDPQDKINRGLGTSSSATGSSLVIETEVPVTITSLKITGGNTDNTTGGSDTYSQKGGGIAIAEGATVTLGNGAVIYKNRGYYGGGIYNAGTLYVYGSAVIGNTAQEQMPVNDAANYAEDGGGIYNVGNVYLGYSSYESETQNTPEGWSGCISYNYSWRGGAINNRGTGNIIMRDGTIGHNQTVHGGGAAGGGGIYNYGSFTMSGGLIEYNYEGGNNGGGGVCNLSSSSYGTGVFTFTGGAIKSNTAGSGNNGVNGGGGVYNNGIMYVYGDAVIGDDSMESIATGSDVSETCSNLAAGQGGGIYVASDGKLYMGYSSYTSETENTPAEWKGGIFYNYAQSGGGGLGFAYGSSVLIHMNSGTIANNGAEKNGGAVYISGDGLTISGTATIPAGDGEVKQSIYYNSSYSLNIADSLSSIKNGDLYIIPSANDEKTSYSDYRPVIKLTDAATEAGLTLADVKEKFVLEPLTATATGIVTQWFIDASSGKVKQNTSTFYVSASGLDSNDGLTASKALPSITSAVSKMSDATVDYTIILSGEILGTQVIADQENNPILANSITIKGKSNTSTTSVPTDVLNANLGEDESGTALTVNTKVPVTLYDIAVKGGHGTEKDGTIIGGGLLICEGGTVSIEQNTRILQNTAASGYGAGVYVSKDAKLFVNSSSHITENTGATSGGGVYVADGGYLRTHKGSGSYITLNTAVNGGGVYLEDGSVYEMFGCYIRVNSVQEGGLGSGVYVSANAGFKMSGAAEVTIPNDVYLKDGAVVEIIDSVSASLSARLTPEKYPVEGGEDVCLIKRTLVTSSYNQTWESISGRFEITSQKNADGAGNTQYWYIDKSTDEGANGKLVKQTGMGLTVEIPIGITNDDIEVVVTSDGEPVTADTKIPVSSNLVFTAKEGMASYTWTLDGEEVNKDSPAAHIYSPDTSSWIKGSYVVYLEARDSAGKYYSYTAQITVSE